MEAIAAPTDWLTIGKIIFPFFLVVFGVTPLIRHGNFNRIHENFVQILAVVLFVPAVLFCLATGIVSENAGVGLLGTMIGYVFGATVGKSRE